MFVLTSEYYLGNKFCFCFVFRRMITFLFSLILFIFCFGWVFGTTPTLSYSIVAEYPHNTNFFAQGLLQLNEKLGPILWQFPPSFKFEPDTMARFLSLLPRDTEAALALAQHHDKRVKQPWLQIDKRRPLRHAVEIRHESFLVPDFVKLLRKHAVALVISDSTENWPHVEDVTADFVYLRLHGTQTRYAGAYEDAALDENEPRRRKTDEKAAGQGRAGGEMGPVDGHGPVPVAPQRGFCSL